MRSFVKSILLILIAFTSIVLVLEWVFHEPVNFVANKLNALEKEEAVGVLYIGNSHTQAIGNTSLGEMKGVNLSLGGQDLFHSYALMQKALELQPSVKVVVIGVDYDVVGYNYAIANMSWMDRLYYRPTGMMQDNSLGNRLMASSNFFLANRKFANVKKTSSGKQQSTDKQATIDAAFVDFDSPCDKRAIEHSKVKFNPQLIPENVGVLEKIISLAEQKGVRVMFVNYPKKACYYAAYNQDVIEHAKPILERLAATHAHVLFLDLWQAPNFNDSHFIDNDHLNEEGVKAVLEEMKEKL